MFNRRSAIILVRGLISAALLFYLFTMIRWDRLTTIIFQINRWSIVIAPSLLLIGLFFAAIRWHSLLKSINIHQDLRSVYAYYLLGGFYSIFLPGVIGGDIVRIGVCVKETNSPVGIITTSVFIERFFGIVMLFFMGSLFIYSLPSSLAPILNYSLIKTIPVLTISILLILLFVLSSQSRIQKRFFYKKEIKGLGRNLLNILNLLAGIPYTTFLVLIVFSALFQATDIVASYVLAKALNIPIPLNVFFVIIPIVYISTILPISLGGLGVREGALVYFLSKMNVMASDAVTLSFLIYFNRVFIGAIGGIIQMFWKKSVKPFS